MWCIGERPDAVGVGQTETRRAGLVWANSVGLRLDRTTGTAFAEALDLVPNHHRQNASV